jgi:hypothetical protein
LAVTGIRTHDLKIGCKGADQLGYGTGLAGKESHGLLKRIGGIWR